MHLSAILSWYVISLHRYGYRASCFAYIKSHYEINLSHKYVVKWLMFKAELLDISFELDVLILHCTGHWNSPCFQKGDQKYASFW